jgi:hypothetical protein
MKNTLPVKDIEVKIYRYLKMNQYWWVVPRISYSVWEADLIAWGSHKGILEVEIKRSWADYNNDKLKHTYQLREVLSDLDKAHNLILEKEISKLKKIVAPEKLRSLYESFKVAPVYKYDALLNFFDLSWRPNYFMYAAPIELAEKISADPNRKHPFGVIGVRDNGQVLVLNKTMRLCKLRPWYMANFRNELFKRSMNFMDKYFQWNKYIDNEDELLKASI